MSHKPYYLVAINDDFTIFDFTSVGPKGSIRKRIVFMPTNNAILFNLAFGDLAPDGIAVDDLATTNNGDRNKILATVAAAVEEYTEAYPDRWISFEGSTRQRTRLYRMAVSINLKELSKRFEILGMLEDETLLEFRSDLPFKVLFVKRKKP